MFRTRVARPGVCSVTIKAVSCNLLLTDPFWMDCDSRKCLWFASRLAEAKPPAGLVLV